MAHLVEFIFQGKAIYTVLVSDEDDPSEISVLTFSDRIAGSRQPHLLLRALSSYKNIKVSNTVATAILASETPELNIESEDIFDLDNMLLQVTNHGLTKKTIQNIVNFLQLVNTYRYQINNMVLADLLHLSSIKTIQNIYSEYTFGDNIPRAQTLESHLNQIDLHQLKTNLL